MLGEAEAGEEGTCFRGTYTKIGEEGIVSKRTSVLRPEGRVKNAGKGVQAEGTAPAKAQR